MKRIVLIFASLAVCFAAGAQDAQKAAEEAAKAISAAPEAVAAKARPNCWKTSLEFTLGFNQTSLESWAAGGYNTLTLATGIDGKANYTRDLMSWNNRLQLNYGFLWSADKENLLQKSNDRIYFESKWAYKMSKEHRWNYTASFDFRTQFTNSYDSYKQDAVSGKWSGTLKSGLLAPAYTNLAFGMEWTPNDWFNINIAPLTGGFTICTIDELKKNYGMKLIDTDDPTKGYGSARFQLGAQVKANAKFTINNNLSYETQLVLFTDYLDRPFACNRVNWDNKINWNISKLLKVGLSTWMIYDPIVTINDVTSLVQFKEFFSISFVYTIANKK